MNMEYYLLQTEYMEKGYREQRNKLEEVVDKFNRYLRKATYELALNNGDKELIKALQAQLNLTFEDEMQLYLNFSEEPAEVFAYEFMTWCERLEKELNRSKPKVPENLEVEIEKFILKITQLYFSICEN